MENNKLEDKYFVEYQKLWQFIKACYKRFGTLDISLMYSVCSNKWKLMEYIQHLLDYEPAPSNFIKYQEQLKRQYEETKKDKWIVQKCYELANDLLFGNVKISEYQEQIKKIYEDSEKLFWEIKK